MTPGQRLRALRERLGLTIRDVETASARVAAEYQSEDYAITPSRLCDIETKAVLPSIYRIHTLAVIYRRDLREIISLYGVDVNRTAETVGVLSPPKSHRLEALNSLTAVRMPVSLDPSFNPKKTVNLGRMVEQWGVVPLAFLSRLANSEFTYAYLGTEDFTMYPLLLPGSFLQVDESKHEVTNAMWRSEYERPIFFIEMRDQSTCSWCSVEGENITLQPHPLSPAPVRVLKHPQEAEVIGQVVGVAMRLDLRYAALEQSPPAPEELN